MSEEFKPIETQEQLNEIIKGRLEREAKKHSEATAELQSNYDNVVKELDALKSTNAELTEKYAGTEATIADLTAKVKTYETDSVKTRICKEVGLPYEFKGRLQGSTEEEIRKDAEELVSIIPRNEAPIKSSEVVPTNNDERDAFKDMLKNL